MKKQNGRLGEILSDSGGERDCVVSVEGGVWLVETERLRDCVHGNNLFDDHIKKRSFCVNYKSL